MSRDDEADPRPEPGSRWVLYATIVVLTAALVYDIMHGSTLLTFLLNIAYLLGLGPAPID